jgi:non-ribosomal peptide synthetase component F/aryl carrier-like protein
MPKTLQNMLKDIEIFLVKVLPVYMVPSMFVPLVRIPRTISGKTDRLSLRRLASEFTEHQSLVYSLADQVMRAPANNMEVALQLLWAEVLEKQVSTIGCEDNFFRLGGDSIIAIRLVALAEARGISLDVAGIFRNPALSDMARYAGSVGGIPSTVIEPFSLIECSEGLLERVSRQCNILVESIQDIYPSTPLQEGLVALSIKSPGAYVIQNVFRIPDSLDIAKLRLAWQKVVEIVPILRTRIVHTQDLGSLQVVANESPLWEEVTCTHLSAYLHQAKAVGIQYGDRLTSFTIIQQSSGGPRHFVWTVHHAVYDGWCLPLILQAVDTAFQGLPLKVPAPFSLFIKHIGETDKAASEGFWLSALEGTSSRVFPTLLSATDKPRADRQISHRIQSKANQKSDGTTQSNLLRTAWALVLAKYTGSKESVFGVTLTGRTAHVPGITTMVGPTITTVPLRIRWSQSTTVSELLANVQKHTTDMIAHEQLGLQSIKRLSASAEAACSFQTLLVIQPSQTDLRGTNSLGLQRVELESGQLETYGLTAECALSSEGVEIHAQYDSKLVSESQMQRIFYQVEHVLGQLESMQSSDRLVDSIEIISPQDIDQILKWNHEYPVENKQRCVHHMFEEQALRQPHAPAIRGWDEILTYQELDRLSNQLSHYLVSLGVGPEVKVPFCFEKSTWAAVSMMAILKAGGTCVALDPSHPIDRLEGIVKSVDATILITSALNAAVVGGLVSKLVIVRRSLFKDLPILTNSACTTVKPTNAAFIIFTSGSTGTPKGILLEHKSIATSLNAHGTALQIGPQSRVLQFAAYTFDISIQDIFTTLARGGCVCIISDHDRLNNLAGAINTSGANWACLTRM